MNETASFSPSDLILRKYEEQRSSLLENVANLGIAEEALFQNRIMGPLFDAILAAQPKVIARNVAYEQEKEGRTGYTPRPEKVRSVREYLQGLSFTKKKVDTTPLQEEEIVRQPLEVVSIRLVVDVDPVYINNRKHVPRIMSFLKRVNELSPAEINATRGTEIKEVHVTVEAMITTIDGHKMLLIGRDLDTDQLLATYLRLVDRVQDIRDNSEMPRLSKVARIIDIYNHSLLIRNQEKQEKHMIHVRTLLFGSSGSQREKYTTADKFSIITV